MHPAAINKGKPPDRVKPNLTLYEDVYQNVQWASASTCIDGLINGAINIAYEAIDRHLCHSGCQKL